MTKKELAARRLQRHIEAYQRHLTHMAFGAWKRQIEVENSGNASCQPIYGQVGQHLLATPPTTNNSSFGKSSSPLASKPPLRQGHIETTGMLGRQTPENYPRSRPPSKELAQGAVSRADRSLGSCGGVALGSRSSSTFSGVLGRTAELQDEGNIGVRPRRNSRHSPPPGMAASALDDVCISDQLRSSRPPTPQQLRASASVGQLCSGAMTQLRSKSSRPLSSHRGLPAELDFAVVGRHAGMRYTRKGSSSLGQSTSLPRLVRA